MYLQYFIDIVSMYTRCDATACAEGTGSAKVVCAAPTCARIVGDIATTFCSYWPKSNDTVTANLSCYVDWPAIAAKLG